MRAYVAGPPATAIGGVASYTTALVEHQPGVTRFDQWWPLPKRSSRRLVRLSVHVLGLLRWIAVLLSGPDLVHLQVTSPGIRRDLLYLRAARALNVPVVAHLHTSGFTGPDATPRALAGLRAIVGAADATIVMSEQVAVDVRAATNADRGRLHVVPNPAPALPIANQLPREHERDGLTVLCVAELSWLKNQAGLAEAVGRLRAHGHDVRLRLVGPRGALDTATYENLRTAPWVTLVGAARGAALTSEYHSADGYVLFSRSEAEPMSVLEAMTCSLPVIGTAVGSVASTLEAAGPGNTVVAPGDVSALVTALQAWIDDPQGRRAIGAANARWVTENRSLDRHLHQLGEVYAFARKRRT